MRSLLLLIAMVFGIGCGVAEDNAEFRTETLAGGYQQHMGDAPPTDMDHVERELRAQEPADHSYVRERTCGVTRAVCYIPVSILQCCCFPCIWGVLLVDEGIHGKFETSKHRDFLEKASVPLICHDWGM